MDAATRASLEILRSRDGSTEHTLLASVQHTLTPAGARLLAAWLSAPLTDPVAIAARQDAWSWCVANPRRPHGCGRSLRTAPDMARALGRLSLNRGTPRDLAAIRDMAGGGPWHRAQRLQGPLPAALADARSAIPADSALADAVGTSLGRSGAGPPGRRRCDTQPGSTANWMRIGRLRDESRQVIATLQLDFAQRFGVASLKINHHAQLGYVIEAPAAAVEKLRGFPELTLRQGMANGARFTTPELSELDQRIREAAERAAARERAVFAHLVRSGAGARRCTGRLRGRACPAGRHAVGGETGRDRHVGAGRWSPTTDEFCIEGRAAPGGGERARRQRGLCARIAATCRRISA